MAVKTDYYQIAETHAPVSVRELNGPLTVHLNPQQVREVYWELISENKICVNATGIVTLPKKK